MGEQTTPTLFQSKETGHWNIVTSWHKPRHPKKKYDVSAQIHHIIGTSIESFMKHMEEEAQKAKQDPEVTFQCKMLK